jgi:hypothetical protein
MGLKRTRELVPHPASVAPYGPAILKKSLSNTQRVSFLCSPVSTSPIGSKADAEQRISRSSGSRTFYDAIAAELPAPVISDQDANLPGITVG